MIQPLSILIVDDHSIFLDGLDKMISTLPFVHTLQRADTILQMEKELNKKHIDLAILDINMNGTNMLDKLDKIRVYQPNIKIIILTSYNDQHILTEAISKDVNGFLSKNATKNDVSNAIHCALRGERYITTISSRSQITDGFGKLNSLTNRELDVLKLLMQGNTNSKISAELYISIHTILSHRKNIFKKLQVNTINELLAFAFNHGVR